MARPAVLGPDLSRPEICAQQQPDDGPIPRCLPGGAEVAVRLDGVTKSAAIRPGYRDLLRNPLRRAKELVLRGVSCEVRTGELFGFLGPNGAGKTTLLKILSTLVVPDAGRAVVLGRDVVRNARAVREVLAPVVAEERSLYWRLSARENLLLFAALHGLEPAACRQRSAELLELVGLQDAGRKLAGEFSSGMRHRLLIARALIGRPKVLLLDEPTRSLDPLSARDLRTFIREDLVERRGATVLLATHNPEEAFGLCQRVGILHRGRLLAAGPADDLARQHGDDRYHLRVQLLDPTRLRELEGQGVIRQYRTLHAQPPEWQCIEVAIPGGEAQAAEVLTALAAPPTRIAGFEKVPLSLADLIERIVHSVNGAGG